MLYPNFWRGFITRKKKTYGFFCGQPNAIHLPGMDYTWYPPCNASDHQALHSSDSSGPRHEMCYAKRKDTARLSSSRAKGLHQRHSPRVTHQLCGFLGPKNIPKNGFIWVKKGSPYEPWIISLQTSPCNSDSQKKTCGTAINIINCRIFEIKPPQSRKSKSKFSLEQNSLRIRQMRWATNPPFFSHREPRLQSRPSIHSSPMWLISPALVAVFLGSLRSEKLPKSLVLMGVNKEAPEIPKHQTLWTSMNHIFLIIFDPSPSFRIYSRCWWGCIHSQ